MTRRPRAVVLFCVLAALATACPGASEPPDVPVPGGTLVVGVRDLGALDPATATGRGTVQVLSQVFDPLTAADPASGAVRGLAAASFASSRGGRVWTFTLRHATYSDGSPVTARDFKVALDRIARKKTASDYAFLLDQVEGFRAVNVTGDAASLKGVVARNPRTLVVTLGSPNFEWPWIMSHPAFTPIPARFHRSASGLAKGSVGNGPFVVESFEREKRAVLVRNPSYRGATPLLDRLEFVVTSSIEDGWRRFLDGSLDVTETPASAVAGASGRYGQGGFTPAWATLSFGLNMRKKVFARPQVRRAIATAIDRAALASGVFGETKTPATGIIPRGTRGFAEAACGSCRHDTTFAHATIAEHLGASLPTIGIDHLNDPSSRRVAQAVANDLKAAGLKVVLRTHTQRRYRDVIAKGTADIAQLGWIADVPSPDGFLARQLRAGSVDNVTGFADKAFDRLLDRARAEQDETARLGRYREAEERALALMPLVPLVFFRNRTAAAAHVRGFTMDGAGLFDAATVWLARA